MLTLFSIPKPFRGHIATIQRNAIRSWTRLQGAPDVMLFGDETGTAEAAAEFGARHMPHVERNEHGTPLLNSMFETAEQMASQPLLCYVNTDIILMGDFARAVERFYASGSGLMVGHRWDVDLRDEWDFSREDWEERLRACVAAAGALQSPAALDYFVFPPGLWETLPPFAVGRTAWDNWLVYRARSLGVAVVDATPVALVVHQNHYFGQIPQDETGLWMGPEAQRNRALAGGEDHLYTLRDATHLLTPTGREPTFLEESSKRQEDSKSLAEYRRRLVEIIQRSSLTPGMRLLSRHTVAFLYWWQGHLERKSRRARAALRSVRKAHELAPTVFPWGWRWILQFWLHTYIPFPFWLVPYWAARKAVRVVAKKAL